MKARRDAKPSGAFEILATDERAVLQAPPVIGRRIFSECFFIEVEDLACSAIALRVGEDLPTLRVQSGGEFEKFIRGKVCVPRRAGRNTKGAAAEFGFEVGFVEQHGPAVGGAVIPKLDALDGESVVAVSWTPFGLVDLVMSHVGDGSNRNVSALGKRFENTEHADRRK